jgi:hypothetical protein
MIDLIQLKRPIEAGWTRLPPVPAWVTLGFRGEAWYHVATGIGVISALEVAKDADGIERGPEYHISISKRIYNGTPGGHPVRCTSQEAIEVLRQFDVDGAEEDNHVPNGIVRNFWRPVAERFVGMDCVCKAAEPAMVEDRGDYVWRVA